MNPNRSNGNASKSPSATGRGNPPATAETLSHLRHRSPQESLGVNDHNGLSRAFVLATALTAMVFAALTAGPYFWDRQFPPAPKPGKAAPADATADNASPAPDVAKKNPENPAVQTKNPAKKSFPESLGDTGVKSGTPVNPLDKKDDDLLKEFK